MEQDTLILNIMERTRCEGSFFTSILNEQFIYCHFQSTKTVLNTLKKFPNTKKTFEFSFIVCIIHKKVVIKKSMRENVYKFALHSKNSCLFKYKPIIPKCVFNQVFNKTAIYCYIWCLLLKNLRNQIKIFLVCFIEWADRYLMH